MKLRAGDWVEVRSRQEILRSLDEKGRLEGLPFMPQMFKYCGQQFRVYKQAHKTCDTVNQSGGRWLPNAVHLELRCDGKAYGGCQAACLIFWKDAWLQPINDRKNAADASPHGKIPPVSKLVDHTGCSEAQVWEATRAQHQQSTDQAVYSCQATQLPYFTRHLPWWDVRQYIADYTSGNMTLRRIFSGLLYASYYPLSRPGGPTFEPLRLPFRQLYDWFQAIWGGAPFPRQKGVLPAGQSAPISTLDLQPGELVRVKSYKNILTTVGPSNTNRGLRFDAELVPYCNKTYRVRARVSLFIDEKTGTMRFLKTPAVILENVWCEARYSDCRLFCPRSIYSWWREVWLERIAEPTATAEEPHAKAEGASGAAAGARQRPHL